MPSIADSVTIGVPPERVYRAFTELSGWPLWNPHLREITPLFEGPMLIGSRARIAPRRGPATVWRVTELEPAREFVWESVLLGSLHLRFDHLAEHDLERHGTRATLRLHFSGPLGFLGLIAGPLYATNLRRALRSLKSLLEAE